MKKPENGFLLGIGLHGQSLAAVEGKGLAGEIHRLRGLDRSGQVAEVEFLGDRMLAVELHHFLDMQLLAVVFVAGLGEAHSEDFGVRESGADGLGARHGYQHRDRGALPGGRRTRRPAQLAAGEGPR